MSAREPSAASGHRSGFARDLQNADVADACSGSDRAEALARPDGFTDGFAPFGVGSVAASEQERPKFGVRIEAGVVTYFNGDPILTYEQGEDVAAKIAEVHGGVRGVVERVYVL